MSDDLVKYLRDYAPAIGEDCTPTVERRVLEAADAIEALTAEVVAFKLSNDLHARAQQSGADLNTQLTFEVHKLRAEAARLREALTRLRDCDWVITLPDRMDAVREIARSALRGEEG